ncbi:MAG: glycosyltransferase family 4 protein [Chloroflexi bacterium]|nr:glycosyltransferase family 4 protein [Chloroflexota bacterium]
MASAGSALIIVENNSVPFDRRVWREAKALRDAGWRVSVICPRSAADDRLAHSGSGGGDYEELEGIRIYRFPLTFAGADLRGYVREYLGAIGRIARLSLRVLRRERVEVVQVCNPPDLFFLHMALFRALGRRVIFDHHDLFPEGVAFRFRGPTGALARLVALVCEWLTFKATDVVMATNESYREIAMRRGGISPRRVVVVRSGPEIATFGPVEPRPELKSGRPFLACYLGIMGADDGIDLLLDAMHDVVATMKRRDVQFVLIGDGPMRLWAMARAAELGLSDHVMFTGRIPEDEVKAHLSTCDVGLSPDPCTPLNNLSTMNKVMEYMVMAKPLVSFDLKEAAYSAHDSAVYVPCGDVRAFGAAIVELLDDPDRRARMGDAGRRRVVDELAWEHQRGRLFAAYQLARERRRRPRYLMPASRLYVSPRRSSRPSAELRADSAAARWADERASAACASRKEPKSASSGSATATAASSSACARSRSLRSPTASLAANTARTPNASSVISVPVSPRRNHLPRRLGPFPLGRC